jgi:cell wall assembly regulator SMI1
VFEEAGVARKSPIGRIAYRDEPEAGPYPVKGAWKRLKLWSRANLPRTEGDDPASASADQLQQFEAAIGVKLPKDVRESYRVYNGQCAGPGIVYGLAVQPLSDCLQQWQSWVKGYGMSQRDGSATDFDSACSSFPVGFVRPVYFDPGWIPLTYDSGGNHVGVDLNPGPQGRRGQVIVFGRDDMFHPVLALSWGQFLTDLADELEAANFRIELTDPDYPEFNLDDPHRHHFHSIGGYWSRGKLGLRTLAGADEKVWKKKHGK